LIKAIKLATHKKKQKCFRENIVGNW